MTELQFAHLMDADALKNLSYLPINFSLAGDNVLITGVSKKRIYAFKLFLVVGANMNLTFKDGTGINLTGAIPMLANGSMVFDLSNVPWFQTTDGNDFILNSSQSGQVSGGIYYQQN